MSIKKRVTQIEQSVHNLINERTGIHRRLDGFHLLIADNDGTLKRHGERLGWLENNAKHPSSSEDHEGHSFQTIKEIKKIVNQHVAQINTLNIGIKAREADFVSMSNVIDLTREDLQRQIDALTKSHQSLEQTVNQHVAKIAENDRDISTLYDRLRGETEARNDVHMRLDVQGEILGQLRKDFERQREERIEDTNATNQRVEQLNARIYQLNDAFAPPRPASPGPAQQALDGENSGREAKKELLTAMIEEAEADQLLLINGTTQSLLCDWLSPWLPPSPTPPPPVLT